MKINDFEVRVLKPGESLDDAYAVRFPVFIDEQGFPYDIDDADSVSYHIVIYLGGRPIATGRVVRESEASCVIGRIAVLKEYRGGTGSVLVKYLVDLAENLGFEQVKVNAQCRARGFYEKQGFEVCGDEFLDEGVPHIPMIYRGK